MTERFFRLIVGALLLLLLYYDLRSAIAAVIGILFFEGVSNYRISSLVTRLRARNRAEFPDSSELLMENCTPRIPFDAERAWRITVALMLIISVYLFHEQLWFFPWFMGFAIFGAGLSGVCPVLISLKLVGFR